MMLFVSKQCATDDQCEEMRLRNLPLCTRISYEDWRCTSCCKGDRCNYYIIVSRAGRGRPRPNSRRESLSGGDFRRTPPRLIYQRPLGFNEFQVINGFAGALHGFGGWCYAGERSATGAVVRSAVMVKN